jgi:hypothetical protein
MTFSGWAIAGNDDGIEFDRELHDFGIGAGAESHISHIISLKS